MPIAGVCCLPTPNILFSRRSPIQKLNTKDAATANRGHNSSNLFGDFGVEDVFAAGAGWPLTIAATLKKATNFLLSTAWSVIL
jgi:hypothetical protein